MTKKEEKPLRERFRELTTPKELIEAEDCFNSKIQKIAEKHSDTLKEESVEISNLFTLHRGSVIDIEISPNNITNEKRSVIYADAKAAFFSCFGELGKNVG